MTRSILNSSEITQPAYAPGVKPGFSPAEPDVENAPEVLGGLWSSYQHLSAVDSDRYSQDYASQGM